MFLSSHLLAEVQALCSRVAIISACHRVRGELLDELRARAGRRYRLTVPDRGEGARICAEVAGISRLEVRGDEVTFAIEGDPTLLALAKRLAAEGIVIQGLVPEQLTLERVFFELTESTETGGRVVDDAGGDMTAVTVGASGRRDIAGGRGLGGVLVAYRGELFKLLAERRTWLGIATAAIGPIIYLLLELAQGPPGAPLADNLGHTGVGFSLAVFKLIAVFGPAVIASLVAGDIVASGLRWHPEDRADTVDTRTQLLLGKLLALYTYLLLAMAVFFLVSTIGGVIAWGFHPLVNISGQRISALHALGLDVPALLVYCMPVIADRQLRVLPVGRHGAERGRRRGHRDLRDVAAGGRGDLLDQGRAPVPADQPVDRLARPVHHADGRGADPPLGVVSTAFALPPVLAALYVFHRRDVT